jgi:ATP-dependent Clp protease protease subunit
MTIIPTIIEKTPRGERVYDIYSRLLEDRIIFLGDVIDDNLANLIIAELLFLQKEDPKKDISLYINSPGGVIDAGMAIYDTMNHITPDVSTIAVGVAASMASIILSSGAKGKRFALPSTSILIHQPHGRTDGQASYIEISARRILKMRDSLNSILAKNTGQKRSKIDKDVDRDFWMTAEEAKDYGIVDKVIK